MLCVFCDRNFTPKRSTGKYCSAKCRAAAWQANRDVELALVEENLTRTLARVRGLRRDRGIV